MAAQEVSFLFELLSLCSRDSLEEALGSEMRKRKVSFLGADSTDRKKVASVCLTFLESVLENFNKDINWATFFHQRMISQQGVLQGEQMDQWAEVFSCFCKW